MTLDPTKAKSTFLRDMIGRGHVYQITDESGLDEYATGIPTGYIGFDCTAKSLHVGSLVQIMNLRRLQQAGGKPIVLMGGGTTKIGGPPSQPVRYGLPRADWRTESVVRSTRGAFMATSSRGCGRVPCGRARP